MRDLKTMTRYYLHVGASTLPRARGEPLTLAQAMHRAHGHRYAVLYRVYELNRARAVVSTTSEAGDRARQTGGVGGAGRMRGGADDALAAATSNAMSGTLSVPTRAKPTMSPTL
jgi:hypothetical protein